MSLRATTPETAPVDVTVVVPTFNAARTLRLLLDVATRETSAGSAVEVVVVDDGSTDDTSAVVARHPGVRYIRQRNQGPAAARNLGAREARGRFVVFIDADIVPEPGFVDRLVHEADVDPDVGGVAGIYSHEPLFADGHIADFRNLQTHFWKASSPGLAVDNFPVSLSLVRKTAYLDAGGLREMYRGADVEDFEFGRRMTARGVRLLVTTRVQGHHHPEERVGRLLRVLFRRTRQYTATLNVGAAAPSHYATNARSLTLVGSVLMVIALFGMLAHPLAAVAAAAAYVGLVWYPEREYYRFLARKRHGVLFLYYGALQLLCNLAMAAGLMVGLLGRVVSPFTERAR